jgi:hypothetical protein
VARGAFAKIEARAKERQAREQAEYDAKLAVREAKTAATGKKPGGKPPQHAADRARGISHGKVAPHIGAANDSKIGQSRRCAGRTPSRGRAST